jgi:hypothetical protein
MHRVWRISQEGEPRTKNVHFTGMNNTRFYSCTVYFCLELHGVPIAEIWLRFVAYSWLSLSHHLFWHPKVCIKLKP